MSTFPLLPALGPHLGDLPLPVSVNTLFPNNVGVRKLKGLRFHHSPFRMSPKQMPNYDPLRSYWFSPYVRYLLG